MQVSLDWLREYVEVDVSPEALAYLLTMAGLEVEGIEEVGGSIRGVVVGQIASMVRHPRADRLSLCHVRVGDEMRPVVCGAGNMAEGDKVALALPGAVLPNQVHIERATIRGEVSEGMMCSEAELGLTANADGIMILPPDAPTGVPLNDVVAMSDVILEIAVTPNRGDCLSLIGIAREVAALTWGQLRLPEPRLGKSNEAIEDYVRVTLHDEDLCPRYTARLVHDVHIGPSPLWLRLRLERSGMRPINNVVDVTNYVMLEYGQPLHAFDFERLEGGEIVVKRAARGDRFVTLDGVERTLDEDTLMICDAARAVAIGGIMGGLNSEIEEGTEQVLLESAYFSPAGIRRASKKLGLQTESSYRFERGIDIAGVPEASARAAALIAELSSGWVVGGAIDAYPVPLGARAIEVKLGRITSLLGMDLSGDEVEAILQRLGMTVHARGNECWTVAPPLYRGDVLREVDVIEEVGRIKGYDAIPVRKPKMWMLPFERPAESEVDRRVKEVLVGFGFFEVITYSFVSPQALTALRFAESDPRCATVALRNPLTEEQSVMRTTLVPGLLETARYNLSFHNRDLKIFEVKEVFHPRDKGKLPLEKKMLAGLMMGAFSPRGWQREEKPVDFFDVKGCVDALLCELKLPAATYSLTQREPYLGESGVVVAIDNEEVGVAGDLHPLVAESFELPGGVFIFELDLPFLAEMFTRDVQFSPLPRYPSVIRDVAVVVPDETTAGEIARVIRGVDGSIMASVEVFDVYEGDPIPVGKKGLAYRVQYRSPEKTLTDKEVNQIHNKVLETLRGVPGLTIR
jgi:phenylalanyl-tRNA synthetase beta chain